MNAQINNILISKRGYNMVTLKKSEGQMNDYYGISTDSKPTDKSIPNASTYYEFDTHKLYMYDAENGVWIEQ